MCDGTTQLFPDPSEPDSNPLLHYTYLLTCIWGIAAWFTDLGLGISVLVPL